MGKEDIAKKLKQARISANKTQKEVGDMLGMTYQAISNYERGKTKVESDVLIKLCNIYNISIPEVLSEKSEGTQKTISFSPKPSKRLERIIYCYNEMNEIGKDSLADQAEYLMGKHPKTKEEKNHKTLKEDFTYVNAAHAENYDNAPEELKQAEEDMMEKNFSGS